MNQSLRITPIAVGKLPRHLHRHGPGRVNVTSNIVTINVTQVPQGAQSTIVSSGGGGGGVTTQTTYIPIQQEVEKPQPLNIIAPGLVTIYQNQTVTIPVRLSNNWTSPLQSIVLSAATNATGVQMSFDSNYIEELPVNGTHDVKLTVKGYRLGDNFEVTLSANVTTPSFHDTALVLFNSIQQSQEGPNVAVKVTFAEDLLSEHDECKELNEILQEANNQLKQGDFEQASDLVDTVINGCQYLISKTQMQAQSPGIVRTPFLELSRGRCDSSATSLSASSSSSRRRACSTIIIRPKKSIIFKWEKRQKGCATPPPNAREEARQRTRGARRPGRMRRMA